VGREYTKFLDHKTESKSRFGIWNSQSHSTKYTERPSKMGMISFFSEGLILYRFLAELSLFKTLGAISRETRFFLEPI
jgi:hypothetical protein